MSDSMVPVEVREERDSFGLGTGVEAEEVQDADQIRRPFDPDRIEVQTRNPTVDLLLSRIRTGRIDLQPDFQRRRGIWTDERQSRLVESLLLRIPLPTLYAAEADDEQWVIVDGIQRLTTISRFIEPGAIGAERLILRGLEYLGKSYDGASFDELPGRLQTRLRETELVVHLIRLGTPEEVKFNIFARINTGGLPLSTQELRHALIKGAARKILKEWAATDEFTSATGGSVRTERMADREMVLRFIAFRLTNPADYSSQDFDDFLRTAMKQLDNIPDPQLHTLHNEFTGSMRAAAAIFGRHAFRKQYPHTNNRFPINKAVFEAVAVNLAPLTDKQIETLTRKASKVNALFGELMTDLTFERAVSQGTGDVAKVRLRFRAVNELFHEVIDD
ncbi:DUF262 domain-containing protein [Frankia sp. AgB32]|uniref:DUF262 domain-containing protein n=1 Tax=Frankia sp. AgB32 TaxID=631119 RepID=UPI00200CF0D3|nr:DUF262 domain-containing protein [Frankia sp. AgB32]MCK9897286.1 DUF262 domain-containing protein [Frankia sp. AgB32]